MSDAPIRVFYAGTHRLHDPADHPDAVERVDRLLEGVADAGLMPEPPRDHGLEPIAAVHSAGLLALLPTAYARFAQLKEGPRPAVPDTFAVRHLAGRPPSGIWAELGYYCNDDLTPILERTWAAVYDSAQVALTAAAAVAGGAPAAYALCRPPGHHAYADLYGGYCYLNNAAIAAEWLARRGQRVAVLDIDYHHGNGTQAIFYDRADVLVSSLHADPAEEYPYYCGYADERGSGAGQGFTLNLPLPLDSDETAYRRALDRALQAVDRQAPDVVLVSVGFDTLAGDPHGGLALRPGSFHAIGRELAALRRPLLLVQEGGYLLPALRPASAALLEGLLA